jgi:hypothetical protein
MLKRAIRPRGRLVVLRPFRAGNARPERRNIRVIAAVTRAYAGRKLIRQPPYYRALVELCSLMMPPNWAKQGRWNAGLV